MTEKVQILVKTSGSDWKFARYHYYVPETGESKCGRVSAGWDEWEVIEGEAIKDGIATNICTFCATAKSKPTSADKTAARPKTRARLEREREDLEKWGLWTGDPHPLELATE